jgi:hypothetical protein
MMGWRKRNWQQPDVQTFRLAAENRIGSRRDPCTKEDNMSIQIFIPEPLAPASLRVRGTSNEDMTN